ncbi:hypothetical protein VKT23_004615 [Stygiomarasmius scandens]|uniref:Uncharacterized protein n=1 Tax=Marasmiellus scandens TaxID=2682957 RepID=A0ABR1JUN0_9AGAR
MQSQNGNYVLSRTLSQHDGPIFCLAVSEDGHFIASGGLDKVKIWDMTQSREVPSPSLTGVRGPATALIWINAPDTILFYRTYRGYLVGWKHYQNRGANFREQFLGSMPTHSEVTSMAFDQAGAKLAVGNDKKEIQLYHLDTSFGKLKLVNIFSIALQDVVPCHLSFRTRVDSLGTKDLMIFGLNVNKIVILDTADGVIKGSSSLNCKILGVDLNESAGIVAIHQHNPNHVDGIDHSVALYKLKDLSEVRVFPLEVGQDEMGEECVRYCQVAISQDAKSVLCGGEQGVVYIFDQKTGKCLDQLKTDLNEGWIQVISTYSSEIYGTMILVASTKQDQGLQRVQMWKKMSNENEGGKIWLFIDWLHHIVIGMYTAIVMRYLGLLLGQFLAMDTSTYDRNNSSSSE